jgi:type II secretory pathway pseudopilin PulG
MNGLPALAQNLSARGRNGDSMLVHMTPGEVNGLQALALAHGGSLSINPDTGLVEANFLKRLLPTLAGAALMIGSGGAINPMTAGMIVGGVEGLRTGDLGKGFMAGLGAYGGAGIGAGLSAAGAQAATANAAPTIAAQPAASYAGGNLAGTVAPTVGQNFATAGKGFSALGTEAGRDAFLGQAATSTTPATGVGGFGGLAKAGMAAASPFMVEEPMAMPTPEDPYANYKGPYKPTERAVMYPDADRRRRGVTSEFTYFTPSNPIPYADGGAVSPQAQVMQNIANVQQMAGIPALGAPFMGAPPAAAPAASREGLVYNPIPNDRTELVYNPIEARDRTVGGREVNYGFKPVEVTGIPPELQNLFNAEQTFGSFLGKFTGNEAFGPRVQYEYDATTQSIRPTKAYLDALETRRQERAAAEAAAAQAAAIASYYAEGGSVPTLEEGGFVLTKKAVDGLGKGDNKKGQKAAQAGLGAIPIKGKGNGTSDSIPTTIAGKQPARVSNGEAYVPARKVKENGGAKAFYALMRRAEKAA